LAAIRHEALASITNDLAFWFHTDPDGTRGALTEGGKQFVAEVFG
jgi:hypothetical protein